eukprot:4536933-Amphidinium_carterae.2
MQRLLAWLDGKRTEAAVRLALSKLDTDLDVTLATGGGIDSKALWQADYFEDAESPQEECAVLAELYSPENDVGFDSDDEGYLWIFAQDTTEELDEEELQTQLVNFAAVQRAKQAHKVARGWSSPHLASKGKSKGKGLRMSDHYGKGKDKGKKGEGEGRFGPQARRDERRQSTMTRVPLASVTSRIRCWKCGQVGHMAKNCHSSFSGGPPGGGNLASANVQTMNPLHQQGGGASTHSSKGSSKGYFVGFTWTDQTVPDTFVETKAIPNTLAESPSAAYFVTSPEVAIVDTGAVNGIVGVTQFEILCKQLARVGLAAHIDQSAAGAPRNVGGIGGGAAVVCTAIVPTALNSIPGLISFIVIAGEVPALLPLPLMKAMGAILDLPGHKIWWQEHSGYTSTLIELPT